MTDTPQPVLVEDSVLEESFAVADGDDFTVPPPVTSCPSDLVLVDGTCMTKEQQALYQAKKLEDQAQKVDDIDKKMDAILAEIAKQKAEEAAKAESEKAASKKK